MKKPDGLFDDIPIWVWITWAVAAIVSFALSAAVIWLIFSVAGWLSSH